jgi:hypothetical protein
LVYALTGRDDINLSKGGRSKGPRSKTKKTLAAAAVGMADIIGDPTVSAEDKIQRLVDMCDGIGEAIADLQVRIRDGKETDENADPTTGENVKNAPSAPIAATSAAGSLSPSPCCSTPIQAVQPESCMISSTARKQGRGRFKNLLPDSPVIFSSHQTLQAGSTSPPSETSVAISPACEDP